ncbi:alpha/beta-hydrolase [Obba rivulosa]|uniref:Alpha/beta-hydrolase n=1 Tax=Obba rivulosa TaxID=1052685 RepID=A0A8E2AVN8_9APHY|nr:alpha/beta-hydrolase [Obba rivulosa]
MDPSAYKDLVTLRGLKYHYFVSRGDQSKPTLLFLHGFPSTSHDWRKQVAFFQKEGYSLIVPDMLGYGGTDKPTDPELYKQGLMAADLIDILDAENVDKAIVIGHDWGCGTTSRLNTYSPERFIGFAFLASGYSAPNPEYSYEGMIAQLRQAVGYDVYGYWAFCAEEGADKILEKHIDSLISMLYPSDSRIWATNLAPKGAFKDWLLADKMTQTAAYISEEEKQTMKQILLKNGLAGPLCWYKVPVSGLCVDDFKQIPPERYAVQKPVFFGACKKDFVCLPALGLANADKLCPNITVKEFDTDHWVQLAAPDELNRVLKEWVDGITAA